VCFKSHTPSLVVLQLAFSFLFLSFFQFKAKISAKGAIKSDIEFDIESDIENEMCGEKADL